MPVLLRAGVGDAYGLVRPPVHFRKAAAIRSKARAGFHAALGSASCAPGNDHEKVNAHMVGCARISTRGQDLTAQIEALNAAGAETIYREKISGVEPIGLSSPG